MVTKSNFLRQQVFALLRESTTSAEEDLEALGQCGAHIRDRMLVEIIARECGLTLVRFLTNDALELYYDIKCGRHDLGYVAKGWADPGFRIGDTVEIGPWEADIFRTHAAKLARFCATRGIALTLQTRAPMSTEIQMDGVIYNEGFNRDTFKKTLESLNACVEKIQALVPGGCRGRHSPSSYVCSRLTEPSGRSH
ncbi:MAG TPA: hypothetical protein VN648_05855 [Candidatus Methylomirabilis sp.]|nr:hypothetical protein [Candidatus Methylomirabilis sp.]